MPAFDVDAGWPPAVKADLDGVIEIEPQPLAVTVKRKGRLLVAVPATNVPALRTKTVDRARGVPRILGTAEPTLGRARVKSGLNQNRVGQRSKARDFCQVKLSHACSHTQPHS